MGGGIWHDCREERLERDAMNLRSHLSHPEIGAGRIGRRDLLALTALGLAGGLPGRTLAAAQGELTWGIHVSLAPSWFDPAEASGIITPFMVLYALHDAMV